MASVTRTLLAATLAAVLLAAGCSSSGSSSSTASAPGGGSATTTNPLADQPAYENPGPYVPGTVTLDLDGRKVEVWYPADPGAEAGQTKAVFEIRDLLPDSLKALVPDNLNPRYTTDSYRGIRASAKGPFPLVLFAHGFGGYPTEYQHLLTHLASWGFVVAAPDFKERGLLALLGGGNSPRADETAVMQAARQRMADENSKADGPLKGVVDAQKAGTLGHSAGVAPALGAAATDPNVKTFIGMAGGNFRNTSTTGTTFPQPAIPDKPGMLLAGGKDQVATLDGVKGLYDAMKTPKRLVVIDDGGHNGFDDLCVIGADQGGLIEIARKVGITPPDQAVRLFNDGCTADFLPAKEAWPVNRHFVTAQLRYELGLDPVPVGLGPGVAQTFLPTKVTYTVDQ